MFTSSSTQVAFPLSVPLLEIFWLGESVVEVTCVNGSVVFVPEAFTLDVAVDDDVELLCGWRDDESGDVALLLSTMSVSLFTVLLLVICEREGVIKGVVKMTKMVNFEIIPTVWSIF